MKKILLIAVFTFCGIYNTSAQEEVFDLTINIAGLNSDKGSLMIALYNKKERFLKKQFKGDVVSIKNKRSA